jgi:stalled ribosome rescue protein Dom34
MIQEIVRSAILEAGDDSFILIGGIKRVTSRIAKSLVGLAPDRVLELDSLDIHSTIDEIARAARAGASELRAATDNRRISEIADQAGASGLGALGPDATRIALDNASVRDLYLTHRYLENHAAEAEQAVRSALDQHASVEEVSSGAELELERLGGMAAGLRFRPVTMESATPL